MQIPDYLAPFLYEKALKLAKEAWGVYRNSSTKPLLFLPLLISVGHPQNSSVAMELRTLRRILTMSLYVAESSSAPLTPQNLQAMSRDSLSKCQVLQNRHPSTKS